MIKLVVAHGRLLLDQTVGHMNQQIVPFVSAISDLVRLNRKWQEQLKIEKERIRKGLITGIYNKVDDTLGYDAIQNAVVTVLNPISYSIDTSDIYSSILPVASIVTTSYLTQKSITDEYTLNREQRAAFMIITSHLDGDKKCRTGIFILYMYI